MCLIFAHFGHDLWIQPRMFRWRLYIMSSRQEPDSFLTPVSWRYIYYISVEGFLYRPTNSMPFLNWLSYILLTILLYYTHLFLFFVFTDVHSTCITLHFIAQTSGTAVASKYATFQLGRCRLDEFFGLRRCPLVAIDAVPWITHWYSKYPNMWRIGARPRWIGGEGAWHCTIWSGLMMLK